MADQTSGFWGSITTEGLGVMINLRLVRHARPLPDGTRLVFAADDVIDVTTDFATVSRRLYAAFDPSSGQSSGQSAGQGGGDKKPGG